MSYTLEVRHILSRTELKKECCARTELSFLAYAFGENGEAVKCADRETAKRVFFLYRKLFSVKPPVSFRRLSRGGGEGSSGSGNGGRGERGGGSGNGSGNGSGSVSGSGEKRNSYTVWLPEAKTALADVRSPSFSAGMKECCRKAFLRCAFLAGGTVSDPENASPYVELYFSEEAPAQTACEILSGFGIRHGTALRRGKQVVYMKNFDGICDFLTLIGAQKARLDFEMGKTRREVTNRVNRALNCDMANIARASSGAEKEIRAIGRLSAAGKMDSLPPALRELAQLRLENRFASLAELGEMLNPPLSKSGVSHRMKKIMECAGFSG